MAIKVPFRNPTTTEVKFVKIGWSWTLFLFSGTFGIPLFLRGLIVWGFVFVAFNITSLAALFMDSGAQTIIRLLIFITAVSLQIFLGVKGNEITAKEYLEKGWQFAEPHSDLTKYAKVRWGIFLDGSPGLPPLYGQSPPHERDVKF